jgi:hypothetical protein
MSRPPRTLDGPLLVGAAFIFVTWSVTRNCYVKQLASLHYCTQDAVKELAPLEDKYGPNRYSRNVEEWAIRDFFQDRRDGVFLDVGSNHYRDEARMDVRQKILDYFANHRYVVVAKYLRIDTQNLYFQRLPTS